MEFNKDEILEWFDLPATKFVLNELYKMQNDSLLLLSGLDSLLSYGRADGAYHAVGSVISFLEYFKRGGETDV